MNVEEMNRHQAMRERAEKAEAEIERLKDAEERGFARALKQASDMAYSRNDDFTCPNCDTDSAHDLAAEVAWEIEALSPDPSLVVVKREELERARDLLICRSDTAAAIIINAMLRTP